MSNRNSDLHTDWRSAGSVHVLHDGPKRFAFGIQQRQLGTREQPSMSVHVTTMAMASDVISRRQRRGIGVPPTMGTRKRCTILPFVTGMARAFADLPAMPPIG